MLETGMKNLVSGFNSLRKDVESTTRNKRNSSPSFWDNERRTQPVKKNTVPGHWDRPVIVVEPPVPNKGKDGDWTEVPHRQKHKGWGHSPKRSTSEMEGETVKEGEGKEDGGGKGRKKTPSSFGSV